MDREYLATPSTGKPPPRNIEIREIESPFLEIKNGVRSLIIALQVIEKLDGGEVPLANVEVGVRFDAKADKPLMTDESGIIDTIIAIPNEAQTIRFSIPMTTAVYRRRLSELVTKDFDAEKKEADEKRRVREESETTEREKREKVKRRLELRIIMRDLYLGFVKRLVEWSVELAFTRQIVVCTEKIEILMSKCNDHRYRDVITKMRDSLHRIKNELKNGLANQLKLDIGRIEFTEIFESLPKKGEDFYRWFKNNQTVASFLFNVSRDFYRLLEFTLMSLLPLLQKEAFEAEIEKQKADEENRRLLEAKDAPEEVWVTFERLVKENPEISTPFLEENASLVNEVREGLSIFQD